uniref:RNA helicase Mov10l1 isoform X3 n=1 Tax=Monopterus albus TaxID=43700 RepID=UPI0009B4928B|nr:RNA helicase Mov10l1 isoform X3 [Monopterus albus]
MRTMLSALQYIYSKMISPLWREEEPYRESPFPWARGTECMQRLQDSVVTQLCLDYGLIDGAIYFTKAEVAGRTSLKEGDHVNCIVARDRAQGRWKAIRVEKCADDWEGRGIASLEADSMQLRLLVGKVTSFDGNGGYINQATYFLGSSLMEGYEPMRGDWVEANYFINPTYWTTQVHSVAPLRYCRLDQVCVTSVYHQNGVVEDSVFFSLDSLLLPANYQPLPGHLVNLVMVESSQSHFNWRALCMAPCLPSRNTSPTVIPETKLQSILENKEGLDVTDYGQFGDLVMGEKRELVLWIQNKGSEIQRLKCCGFADWDSMEQFTLVTVKGSTPLVKEKRQSGSENCSESSEEQVDENKENGEAVKEKIQSTGVRRVKTELDIPPGERVSVVVACQGKSLGTCAELLLLHFSSFTIGRHLEVTVCSTEENLLQLSVPFIFSCPVSTVPTIPARVITVLTPKGPPRLTRRKLPNFLPNYPVPQALRDCVELGSDVLVIQPCLGEVLSPSNLRSRFSALLWLEELHAEKELREFTIIGALLRKGATYLHLEILGLGESRPHLNKGDKILLKKPLREGVVLECISYVAEINDEDVSLKVNSEFLHSYIGEPLDVEFCYNTVTMRRCHKALDQTKPFGEILFPSRVTLQTPQWTGKWIEEPEQNKSMENNEAPAVQDEKISSISGGMKSKATQTKDGQVPSKPIPSKGHFFNPDLNPAQREAVKRILAGECRPIPYVLFGPPGTGKTITLIEAILQVYHFLPSSRILVCTPSNSAADLICIRLHDSGFLHAASFARVNASYRQEETIPEVLRSYSKAGEDIRHASFHRIVVCTCSSAGLFYNLGLQVGHFTHVFLDEAGQATEPETLIPICFVSERDGQIVLAGDPFQLGPIVKSKLANAFGLGVSLLERLMANPLYSRQDSGYNPKLVTKLIYNYRSHEVLLTLPSRLFYQEELCFKAPRDIVNYLCEWTRLPKKGFPLLFHGIRGREMRECHNPSWFNPVEAVQVMFYCCQLAKKLYNPVDASDIGIISPYKKQCEKIRLLLGKVGLSDVKVGSVEEFQGREFLVIILSTVRSNESVQIDDLESTLGFLANPKRFNVAVSRAKALLLVVGNPHVLIRDPCFRALLHYSYINGAYLGCDVPPSLRSS